VFAGGNAHSRKCGRSSDRRWPTQKPRLHDTRAGAGGGPVRRVVHSASAINVAPKDCRAFVGRSGDEQDGLRAGLPRDQDPHARLDALQRAGCARVVIDRAADYLRPSDQLVITKLGRIGRSVRHLIEQAALDETVPVVVALRHCLALGGRAGSTALRDWASKELQGYGPDDDLPAYRVLPAMLKVDGAFPTGWIKGQPFSQLMLPDFVQEVLGTDEQVHLRQGIAEIEKLIADAHAQQERVKVALPDVALIAEFLTRQAGVPGQRVMDIYWHVPDHVNNAQATGGGQSTVIVSGSEPDSDGPSRRRWA
jgi:AbiTii